MRIREILIKLACYANRNLRCTETDSRAFRFVVIRSRTLLKKIIGRNLEYIHRFGRVQIRIKGAGRMELLPNDYIDRWLFTGADFEPHILRLLMKYVRTGDRVLDIGANIGYHTLVAANLVGPNGRVDCFEPSPFIVERLRKNIQLNACKNIFIHQVAVSAQNEEIKLKIPSDFVSNSGRSSFRNLEENYSSFDVQAVRLDDYFDRTTKISLIKIDIEGAEGMALDGMRNIIKTMKPIVIMELSQEYLVQLRSSTHEILNYFWDQGYQIFIVGEKITPLRRDNPKPENQVDILCLPDNENSFK